MKSTWQGLGGGEKEEEEEEGGERRRRRRRQEAGRHEKKKKKFAELRLMYETGNRDIMFIFSRHVTRLQFTNIVYKQKEKRTLSMRLLVLNRKSWRCSSVSRERKFDLMNFLLKKVCSQISVLPNTVILAAASFFKLENFEFVKPA